MPYLNLKQKKTNLKNGLNHEPTYGLFDDTSPNRTHFISEETYTIVSYQEQVTYIKEHYACFILNYIKW